MLSRTAITTIVLLLESIAAGAVAADRTQAELEQRYAGTVHPFLESYCFSCHDHEKQKGKLDLSPYSKMETVVQNYRLWEIVLEKLTAKEMPPEEAKRHPTSDQRREVIDWILAMRQHEAERNAGDPGPVLARRLSNAEYDYTIRDLTGVDIRPTKEFPVDPANEAGFDNSGESLAMSPALLKKYLETARQVAEHLVLKPEGFAFAPHPAVTDTDRDKYCVKRIIQFYQRQTTDYAAYFMAAWRYQNRAALGKPAATLADFAAENKISSKYLATVWTTLTQAPEESGPTVALQALWRALPSPNGKDEDAAGRGCEQMRDFVVKLRQKVKPEFKNLTVRQMHNGSQTLVLWKDRQYATNRMRYTGGALDLQADQFGLDGAAAKALVVPTDETARERYEAAFKQFCAVFPDAFYVSERARVYLDPEKEKLLTGRFLSAGFHSQMGYFRDDAPLYELILDQQGQRELDTLWQELDFVASAPIRQHTGFIWFERTDSRFMMSPEFDFARAEDKDATSEAKIKQLSEVYLAKARTNGASAVALDAIDFHFKNLNASIRWIEQARVAAEPSHLKAIQSFAERAYGRPLSQKERDDVLVFYRALRDQDGLGHEEAVRDTIVSVLMSPYFCYRVDLSEAGAAITPAPSLKGNQSLLASPPAAKELAGTAQGALPGNSLTPKTTQTEREDRSLGAGLLNTGAGNVRPLSDYALASRLSYFLWSSMPDETLLARAAAGDLHRPEVLVAQARRMLQDDRVRGLATEFGGNWLDFRRFEEHNSVDRERFKTFNNELRQAMFEEPIRFFVELVRENRSVLDFLYADYTLVNPILAKHYGMPDLHVRSNEWVRVENARRFERGGLLPMSVFLTKNAPGLRTSPVKRGYWVIRRLLGEHVPAPPPAVPELPTDEVKLGDLTLRETLARHRDDKSCASCHVRFDAIGLVFEGYGPVGELRTKDFGGRPVDTHATFPGGSEGTGLNGLRDYLRAHRQEEFLDNLCRKLLSYALGRGLLLSDDATIKEMRTRLAANGHRFDNLVESIVTSPQFLNKRGRDDLATK
jgi:hypothetical protein